MIKLIRSLLGLCNHSWDIHTTYKLIDYRFPDPIQYGTRYIMKCKHCGELKSKDFCS